MVNVLVVDDSVTIRMSIQAVLTKKGFRVETAVDGTDALSKLDGFRPDIVITDLNMPQMNGVDLIAEMRKRSVARFVPILMLTNESERRQREAAKAAGATGWLVKPISAEDLMGVLESVLPGLRDGSTATLPAVTT